MENTNIISEINISNSRLYDFKKALGTRRLESVKTL